MVTLAVLAGRRADRDRRARAHRPATASASTRRPLRADAPTSSQVDLGPGLHARFERRPRVAAAPFGPLGPAQMVPWLGQYWAPWLLAARASPAASATASWTAPQRLRREELGRRVRRPLVVGPGASGVAFAGGRVHGVAPTAVAVWTPDELVTLAPPLARTVARAGGGEWHDPRALAALARGARGRGDATRCCCPSRSRASAGSRSAPATTCSAASRVRVRRGRRLWFAASRSLAALEDGATPRGS